MFDVFKQASRGVKESRENVTGEEEAVATGAVTKDITEVSLPPSASAHAEAMSLAKKLANLQMIDLDESSKELLSDAKELFKEARSKARDAFSNEGLDTHDRILAMMVRVMATILNNVDHPRNALTPCRVSLKELHALPAVKKSFKTALEKGWKSRLGKDERKEIIAAVCDINHAIFDVTHMAGSDGLVWPLIDVGAESIHPLRDPRVTEINQQSTPYIGYYPMQWSFGADILKSASGICTNTKDQFLVGDNQEKNIKVFDSDGNFLRNLEVQSSANIYDVETDQDDNIYVLLVGKSEYKVDIFNEHNKVYRGFVVNGLQPFRLYIVVEKNSYRVWVLGMQEESWDYVVNVYEDDGTFVRSFPLVYQLKDELISVNPVGIIITCYDQHDGRLMVLDSDEVYVFSAEGDSLRKFSVGHKTNPLQELKKGQAILWTNKHLIVISECSTSRDPRDLYSFVFSHLDVTIHTEDGELVNHFPLSLSPCYRLEGVYVSGITMNSQGRIALALRGRRQSEVLVV